MVENLDAGLKKAAEDGALSRAATSADSQPYEGLIHQTDFVPPITRAQGAPSKVPLTPVPVTPENGRDHEGAFNQDLYDLKNDTNRLTDWDKQGPDERRTQEEQRKQQNQHEPTVAELIEQGKAMFASGKDKAGAIDLFEQAIRKADAQGMGTVKYATDRLHNIPPDVEPDQATMQRLSDLVEHSVDKRVDARNALADALDSSGDHASAQAVRDDATQVFLSMLVPFAHAEKKAQEDEFWNSQKPEPPRQFDI
jgi:hypothetical protein